MIFFIIIYGTRGIAWTKGRGQFNCPGCATERAYVHKRVRRFFTLYFIPLIPLDLIGEYVECRTCERTWDEAVLQYRPQLEAASVEAQFQAAMKRVMVLMMLADGVVAEEEVAVICNIYRQLSGTALDRQAIEREIAAARADGRAIDAYLRQAVGTLNDKGKELVMRAAHQVAGADGVIQLQERALLAQIGKALDLSSKRVEGIIAEAA